MPGRRLTQLTTTSSLAATDLLYVVDISASAGLKSKGITKEDLAALMGTTAAAIAPIENNYADITALLADQGNQTTGFLQYVIDASADPNISSGEAYYEKLSTSTATLADDYRLLSDTETTVVTNSTSYRVFKIEAVSNTSVTSVSGGKVSFEYSGANATAVIFNKIFTDALVELYNTDVNILFYNRNLAKFETETIDSSDWSTVNTDYYRAAFTGTKIQTADLTVNDSLEFYVLPSVASGGGSGTVTSVAQTVPTGFTVSGSPITTNGTLAISYDTGYQGYTTSEASKLSGIEAGADVTDSTNVDAAGAVMEVDFNANTILAANTDDTPAAVTIAEQQVVGRITSGNIKGLSQAELRTLLAYLEELIDGTADEALTVTGATNVDLSAAAHRNIKLTGNATLTFTNTPASGKTITRTYKIYSDTAETLGIANSTAEYGEYVADGTENLVTVMASNTGTEGLDIHVFFSTPS